MPPVEVARAAASALSWGSACACWARTRWRSFVKVELVVKELGLGGSVVVVPRARDGVGGVVGRKVNMWVDGLSGCGNVYMLLFEGRVLRVRRRRIGCGF
jgi:hypothetical protein